MAKIQNPTKVITGVNTRWSYANVWDAKSINGGAPKYSVSLIIPKSDTVTVNKINPRRLYSEYNPQSSLASLLPSDPSSDDQSYILRLRYSLLRSR